MNYGYVTKLELHRIRPADNVLIDWVFPDGTRRYKGTVRIPQARPTTYAVQGTVDCATGNARFWSNVRPVP
jgi:hypothetical protein